MSLTSYRAAPSRAVVYLVLSRRLMPGPGGHLALRALRPVGVLPGRGVNGFCVFIQKRELQCLATPYSSGA